MTTVHLVEPGGRGGIYQHTVALVRCLAGSGVAVELHTAARPESLPVSLAAPSRPCSWFFPRLRPRSLRHLAAAAAWLAVGVPSSAARLAPGDVVHVQGRFHPVLLLPLLAAAWLRRCRVVLSPHTTFSRRRPRLADRLLPWMARRAHAVVVFSEQDRAQVEAWGGIAVRAPFPCLATEPDPELVAGWRRRWVGDGDERVVLFAGQLRPDKGLDVALRAAQLWGDGLVLVVVGEDVGVLDEARRLAAELAVPVEWSLGYHPLPSFLAAVAAADVVVCPYRRGGQSGVLGVATALGRPTVATPVGGMEELATVVVASEDPAALAEGVRHALDAPRPRPPGNDDREVARAYAELYGL